MLKIPEESLPKEFKDEARLDSLYSPFRSRSVNPRDWDTKIESWRQLIYLYCVSNGVYSFSLVSLNKLLIRHGRPPSCLSTVLEELVRSGELQRLEDFLKESPKGWGGWVADLLVKRPLLWSYNTVKRSLFAVQSNPERVYVHVAVIKQEAQKLLSTFPKNYINAVIDFDEFLSVIGRDLNQTDDVKLLLHCLVQEQKADVFHLKNKSDLDVLLVKIAYENKAQISETDTALYVLQQNEKLLTKNVEDLEDDIERCVKEVKVHLLKSHRKLAKTCLKKKHEIEKRLTHKLNALHNVQVLLERVKDVQYDAQVWQTYKEALSAFTGTIKEAGLNEDSVEDTMLKLGEMLDIHEDIQTTISKPVTMEDEDLEEELAEIMKVEETPETCDTITNIDQQLAELNISDLPDLPSANVSVPDEEAV